MHAQKNGPLYLKIYRCLKERILTGKYLTNDYLPSEKMLSEEFNVQRATVRRSLELLVRDGLIEKVMGSGSRVSFKMDTGEAMYSLGHAFTNISFVLPGQSENKIAEPFMSSLFDCVEAEGRALDYNLFYTHVSDVQSIPPIIVSHGVSAVIWVSHISRSVLEYAYHHKIPSLVYGSEYSLFNNILLDSFRGSMMATQHLVENGHKKIATICGYSDYHSTIERLKGYRKACTSAGIEIPDGYVVHGDWGFSSGYEAMKQFLALDSPPTAIFAHNDMMALGAVKAAVACGKRVPEDISVVGFDNVYRAEQSIPSLTTVGCPPSVIAHQIVSNLPLNREATEYDVPLKIIIPVKLFKRNSVAPPP